MNLIIGSVSSLYGARWIDVCQSNGHLLVLDCYQDIEIFDKRESKIVKTFEGIHRGKEFHSILIIIRY